MKKIPFILLFVSTFAFLQAEYSFDLLQPYPRAEVSYDFGGGYRQDNLKWSISGYRGVPDILSELQWKDLQMAQVYGQIKIALGCIYLKTKGGYANIFHGSNQDSDYLESGRNFEFSRSKARTSGSAFDILGGVGVRFPFFCERLILIPVGGYSDSEIDLHDRHGNQIINYYSPDDVGPFPGLHSKYKAKWFGPWAGLDAEVRLYPSTIRLLGSFEYHWADYRGTGHWNLRDDFAGNIHHKACGFGLVGMLGLQYEIWCGFTLSLYGIAQHWHASDGRHWVKVYTGNPYAPTEKIGTKLNKVTWNSYSALATIGYNF